MNTTHYATPKNEEGVYIPKSYQYERDMDKERLSLERHDSLEFPAGSNDHYLADDIDELLRTEGGRKTLSDMIKNFKSIQCERLDVLDKYAQGENVTINNGDRRIEKNKSDHRIAHNFGGYISDLATDFILSLPVTVSYMGSDDDEGTNDIDDVNEINRQNDIDTLNYELGYDASVFGRAFEFHYRKPSNPVDYIVRIDPQEMFVIRDKTVKREIIGAVHCPSFNDEVEITIYTSQFIYSFKTTEAGNIELEFDNVRANSYGRVPVVEWWNNRYRKGDFESEIDSIDAYDSAQSDTANYMTDLNDALLVIKGDIAFDRQRLEDMKDINVLTLETGMTTTGSQTSADAGYIYKQYDVAGSEAYKTRILDNIHLLSRVPQITDEKFGTQSGIALMYKLFGFKQLGQKKARYFAKALKNRYAIIQTLREAIGGEPIDATKLTFTFHENLPKDVWEEIKHYIDSGGELSQQTLREHTTFTDNLKERERIDTEEQQRAGMTPEELAFMYGVNNDSTRIE